MIVRLVIALSVISAIAAVAVFCAVIEWFLRKGVEERLDLADKYIEKLESQIKEREQNENNQA